MTPKATEKPELLPMESLCKAAGCLKVLAHPVRLRIVDLLMQGEFPVHEVARACGTGPAATCEHLRLMQSHGLLASSRRGRAVYYRVANPNLPGVLACIRKNCGGE